MNLLEANGLKKYFTTGTTITKAVDDISMTIGKGEFVSIVGTSGSGKTSLLNLLGGLDVPDQGEVFLNGKNITKMTDEQRTIFRRRNTGFIFQDYNLIPIMNVRENIVLPIEMDGQKIDEDFFDEIINIIGIQKKISNMPNQLSGGEKQRVAIARAILSKPQIIFADEPTGNLDTESTESVMSLLKMSNDAFHQSIILITHNPLLAQLSDRIIRIEDGKIRGDVYV